jgi:hypothetical protein
LQTAIDDRLHALGMEERWNSFPAVAFLCRSHSQIATTDDLQEVLYGHVYPFLLRIFAGEVPLQVREACQRLGLGVQARIARAQAKDAVRIRSELERAGLIAAGDLRPLSTIACEYPLRSGADHVLVGMRRIGYVDALKPLF